MTRTLLAAALLALTLTACTAAEPEEPAPAATAPAEREAAWSAAGVRVDRVPPRLRDLATDLPATFPADDAVLPRVLDDPPGRAVLAYSPRESFADTGGWATERLVLLGTDGAWRSLELDDLGLPEATWPGVDTYGAGYLAPDGRTWLGRHRGGVVLLDLRAGGHRGVALPGTHTAYAAWHPSSRSVAVVRLDGRRTYRTWSVDRATGEARRLRWGSTTTFRLPLDGYTAAGEVVTFARRGGVTERVVRVGDRVVREPVAVPYPVVRNGGVVGDELTVLGRRRSLLVVRNDTFEPLARLASGRGGAAGWPRGWLGDDTFYVTDSRHGLLSWDVTSGEVRALVRPQGAFTPNAWWSADVATDLLRDRI